MAANLSTIDEFALQALSVIPSIESKPLRTVLRWQVYVTLVVALVAGVLAGMHAALSALLGGLVSWLAGLVFAVMVSGNRFKTAGATLRALLRAAAGKIMLTVMLLWLVLTVYDDVVAVVFFAAFVVSVLVSQTAILVRERRAD